MTAETTANTAGDTAAADPAGTAPAPTGAAPRTMSYPRALVKLARPKQWAKNVLVFAAPLAAGALREPGVIGRTAVAFVAFSLAASGTYFINDALDHTADRLHPKKKHRPIAAGLVRPRAAILWGIVLLAAALAVSVPISGGRLTLVVGVYLALTVFYSTKGKQIPIVELAAVAAGFVIRAIAGGVAAQVPLSEWFLIVASFGSLFMVAGKRHAEISDLGTDGATHRAVLVHYSTAFLGQVRTMAMAVTVTGYGLWAFGGSNLTVKNAWIFQLSMVPFVLALLRYAMLVDQGRGGAPEEVVLSDRALQLYGLLWVVVFAIGVAARG